MWAKIRDGLTGTVNRAFDDEVEEDDDYDEYDDEEVDEKVGMIEKVRADLCVCIYVKLYTLTQNDEIFLDTNFRPRRSRIFKAVRETLKLCEREKLGLYCSITR